MTTASDDGRNPRGPVPAGPALVLDLAAESEALRRAMEARGAGHDAKTLLKQADMRVVLIVLRAGARIQEHKTDHSITVHTLTGRVRLRLPDQEVVLPAQQALFLDKSIPHDVVADEDSALLLSICWTGAGA